MRQPEDTSIHPAKHQRVSRSWLLLAGGGLLIITGILIIVALVTVEKTRFADLTGGEFLLTIVGGLFVGALAMLVGTLKCVTGRGWRRITLIAWALLAIGSPAFGWMIILPWLAMAISLPLVIAAYYGLWQQSR